MRGLFAFLGGALVVFLAVGWYLNWYTISREKSTDGHSHIEVDLNEKKIENDVQRGVKAGADGLHNLVDKKPGDTPKNP